MGAEHRRRHHQLPRIQAQRAHPPQDHPGQRTRHTQRLAGRVKAVDPGLFQHRPAVQWVPAGVLEQAADGAARQLPGTQRPAQRHHLRGPQAAQPDPAGPVVPGQETLPPLAQPGQLPRPGRHHHQHLIGVQPAYREQQRPRRWPIGPLQIIDNRQHHPPELTEPGNQVGADRKRVHPAAQPRGQQRRRAAPAPRALATSSPTIPYGSSSSSSSPLARSTAVLASPDANRASRVDLPMPASPSTSTTCGWPQRAADAAAASTASSPARPTNTPPPATAAAGSSLHSEMVNARLLVVGREPEWVAIRSPGCTP